MDTSGPTLPSPSPGSVPGWSERLRHSHALFPLLAVLVLAVAGLVAGVASLLSRSNHPLSEAAPAATAPVPANNPAAVAAAPATTQVAANTASAPNQAASVSRAGATPSNPSTARAAQAPVAASPTARPAAATTDPITHAAHAPATASKQSSAMGGPPARPVCSSCGRVESVATVQRQTPVEGLGGTGVTTGAVAGGVIGGLLGNQVGHGNGRAAATVLGAAGGAYAGHQVQKHMATYTAYVIRVRMDDGSVRTLEQREPMPEGARVSVRDGAVQLLQAPAAPSNRY